MSKIKRIRTPDPEERLGFAALYLLVCGLLATFFFACSGCKDSSESNTDSSTDADTDTDSDTDTDGDTDIDWGEPIPCENAPRPGEVCVPGGKYVMGCVPGDVECEDNEKPLVQVTLSSLKVRAWGINTSLPAYQRERSSTARKEISLPASAACVPICLPCPTPGRTGERSSAGSQRSFYSNPFHRLFILVKTIAPRLPIYGHNLIVSCHD